MVRAPDDTPLAAEEQLAALGQAVISTDPAGVVVYWNPAAEALYGWSAQEAVGRNIASLSVPEMARDVAADIMAALRDGVAWSGGFPVRRKDGSMFPALVTDAGIYRDGVLVGVVGVSTNLGTALRPILERSTDAALVMRADAVVTYASPAVHQLFGWEDTTLVGTSIIPLLHEEDRHALAEFLQRAVTDPGAHPPVELRVRRGEEWVWAEAAVTNLLDDPTVRGVVCNLRISPAYAARQEAEARAAQLQRALESRLVIEQAKGYLAARHGYPPEDAFQRLRTFARSHHLAIHEASRRVLLGQADVSG
jgi:PAS domain S-box-containing protein